jgi:hypothetical protein
MLCRIAALLALPLLVPAGFAQALEAPRSFQIDYAISLYGVNVGRSSFKSTIEGENFTLKGNLASAGIARVFDDTKGTTMVTGRLGGRGPTPDTYLLNYTSGKKKGETAIDFEGGNVARTENVPPLKRKKGKWVDLEEGDLRAVSDPISATIVKADSMEDVCRRTLKVYDGQVRADLKLSFVKTEPAEAKGFSGEAVTCRARFIPVAGYRQGNKSINYLRNKSQILISFAPLGETGVYAPIRASVGTEIGTITVAARRFEAVD